MEITRRESVGDSLGMGPRGEFRAQQLHARDMLKGDLEGHQLEQYVQSRVLTTTLDKAANWARGNAMFPLTFGLACCAIEMMSIVGARVDVARFGFEAFRASPRQADLLILSGRISIKMAPVIRRLYDQMLEPKWVRVPGRLLVVAGRVQQLRDRSRERTSSCRGRHTQRPRGKRAGLLSRFGGLIGVRGHASSLRSQILCPCPTRAAGLATVGRGTD
jgi:hypothetical protein